MADIAREDWDCIPLATGEFLNAFYIESDAIIRQAMLDAVPIPTTNPNHDAWTGAAGEHLAQRWGLNVPAWTQETAFMGETTPHFRPEEPIARGVQLVETPPAFRRRLLFSWAEPLPCAKLPNHRKVRMPFWT